MQVKEETGLDIGKIIVEEDCIERHIKQQRSKLYIITGVGISAIGSLMLACTCALQSVGNEVAGGALLRWMSRPSLRPKCGGRSALSGGTMCRRCLPARRPPCSTTRRRAPSTSSTR